VVILLASLAGRLRLPHPTACPRIQHIYSYPLLTIPCSKGTSPSSIRIKSAPPHVSIQEILAQIALTCAHGQVSEAARKALWQGLDLQLISRLMTPSTACSSPPCRVWVWCRRLADVRSIESSLRASYRRKARSRSGYLWRPGR